MRGAFGFVFMPSTFQANQIYSFLNTRPLCSSMAAFGMDIRVAILKLPRLVPIFGSIRSARIKREILFS